MEFWDPLNRKRGSSERRVRRRGPEEMKSGRSSIMISGRKRGRPLMMTSVLRQ